MALLDDIRTAVRVSPVPIPDASGIEPDAEGWEPTYTSDYDGELQALIDAALIDLLRKGVRPALLDPEGPDPLVKQAVTLYSKAHFGYDNSERGEFLAAYNMTVTDLENSSANVEEWRVSMDDCGIADIPEQAYTGRTIRPVPEVDFDGTALEIGRDFTVTYRDNVEPGTATAYIWGTGEYSGVRAVEFEVAE